LIIYIYTTNCL